MSARSRLSVGLLAVLLLILSTGAFAADSGLVGWWKFDEGAGTTAGDSSRNGNTGTLAGPEWIAPGWDQKGHCLEFLYEGDESDVVDLGHMDVVGEGITITAWANPYSFSRHDARIISKSSTGATADGHWWMLGTINGVNVRFRLKTNESATTLTLIDTAGVLVTGEWQFITARWDGTTASTYVNTVETGSAAKGGTAVALDPSVPAAIGNQPAVAEDGPRGWDGLIDDVRVYNRALTLEELDEVMLGAGPGAATELASAPVPGDAQTDVPRDTVLSWAAGLFAGTHDVYLGTSLDDVNVASRTDALDVLVSEGQTATMYESPAVLEYGQTYYWRVDEVNTAPDNTIFKGDLWSFTVEPVAYPIEAIVATSNAVPQAGADPASMIDGSGLNENDEHSIAATDMWLGAPAGDDPVTIEYAFDQAYKLREMLVWNYNVQFELMLGFGIKDVTVEYSENGADWTVLGDVTLAQGTARADYAANTTIDFGGVKAQSVRLTVNSGHGMMGQYGLSEVRFLYIPVSSREPQPADGQAGVSPDAVLTWRAGREAVSHEVYFGADEQAVVLVDTVGGSSYAPDDLELGTTYYWKVGEVNEAMVPTTWDGPVWSFSTQEYLVVDDFESYDNEDNVIYETWIDGWFNETGSTVGYLEEPFAERTIVHEGSQSMPLFYDNASAGTSEAERALAGQDWTEAGITTLTLYFRGDPDNSGGQLYVKINGVKVTYDGDADALATLLWQPWNIDLVSVGTNLGNVTTLLVGVEGGGSGVVYIDDIRLY
jgi:Concanavalin A-like lectin/glucanases superfamily/F5/8 type C domain